MGWKDANRKIPCDRHDLRRMQRACGKGGGRSAGVEEVTVSLLTNSMHVAFDRPATAQEICSGGCVGRLWGGAGKALPGGRAESRMARGRRWRIMKRRKLMKRLIASLCLLLPLMYVSMGHKMWGWPVPTALGENPMAIGLYEMLLAGLIMVINQRFFISGFQSLMHGGPNMDTLVSMGSVAAFGYSVAILFSMSSALLGGNLEGAAQLCA